MITVCPKCGNAGTTPEFANTHTCIRTVPAHLGILSHDGGKASVVWVAEASEGSEYVWVTFGEVTPNGFSPCYATTPVLASDVHTMITFG